jgi:hypothetical protein
LTGHTCDVGTAKYNQKLSERRALAIKKYLAGTGVVPADTIIAEGQGENNPRYPNTKATRYKNRRVDLEFVTFTEKLEDVVLPAEPVQTETVKPKEAAKVEWVREYIDTEPAWLTRALHNTLPHKQSVDVYRQQESEVKVTSGDKLYLNRLPVAVDDRNVVPSSMQSVLDVLANDTDPDGDTLTIVSFTQPDTGSISQLDNTLVFKPQGVFKSSTFSYTISDGKGGTSSATVTLIDP